MTDRRPNANCVRNSAICTTHECLDQDSHVSVKTHNAPFRARLYVEAYGLRETGHALAASSISSAIGCNSGSNTISFAAPVSCRSASQADNPALYTRRSVSGTEGLSGQSACRTRTTFDPLCSSPQFQIMTQLPFSIAAPLTHRQVRLFSDP